MAAKTPNLTLYTAQTPNGTKISIALSILNLPYKVHPLNLATHEQKLPWFTAINPNGRLPALTDHSPPFPSSSSSSSPPEPLHIMESGAILLYLVSNYDTSQKLSFSKDSKEHWEMVQWVFWQNAGLGPMQGQSNHFVRYSPEKIPYAVGRYVNESRRLYTVLEGRLKEQEEKRGSGWIVGDHVSIADITVWCWAIYAEWGGIGLEGFERVRKWRERVAGVEGVEEGRNVPEPSGLRDADLGDEVLVRGYVEGSRKWILEGMRRDAEA
ncbi:hypothetical protein TWF730_006971 [Orbilia blumenaviensis]|uniref:Glutathione S-transferase n=1 Tax=Orbilia blumenaviensis TaxID=1796055 RepID=A0AAV9VFV2_9PEZI